MLHVLTIFLYFSFLVYDKGTISRGTNFPKITAISCLTFIPTENVRRILGRISNHCCVNFDYSVNFSKISRSGKLFGQVTGADHSVHVPNSRNVAVHLLQLHGGDVIAAATTADHSKLRGVGGK